jgi:hypothetical protein
MEGGKAPGEAFENASVGQENGMGAHENGEPTNNKASETGKNSSPTLARRFGDKKGKVACLREGRLYDCLGKGEMPRKTMLKLLFLCTGKTIPVAQIYSLDPAKQPSAWLDVLASANTSHDEKMEATEEVLILAKDKQRARIFVEEGILDSIMWTVGRYFEKVNMSGEGVPPAVSREDADAAKRAATLCVTLGKSYCAAIHTEGDLLLMSLYERGTVPEERQLAQMLHEVPHHVRVTKTEDPTVVDPANEVFALRQLTLPQAEELAAEIKALADSGI